jgi:hypothetical protein
VPDLSDWLLFFGSWQPLEIFAIPSCDLRSDLTTGLNNGFPGIFLADLNKLLLNVI